MAFDSCWRGGRLETPEHRVRLKTTSRNALISIPILMCVTLLVVQVTGICE